MQTVKLDGKEYRVLFGALALAELPSFLKETDTPQLATLKTCYLSVKYGEQLKGDHVDYETFVMACNTDIKGYTDLIEMVNEQSAEVEAVNPKKPKQKKQTTKV